MEESELLFRAGECITTFGEECPLTLLDINKKCTDDCSQMQPLDCWKKAITKGWIKI